MRLNGVFIVVISAVVSCVAQTPACRDIADEPNHQLLYQNQNVRIFQLDLPRLKSTEQFCVAHPYVRIAATNARIADLIDGSVTFDRDWTAGEARYVFEPKKKAIRNELGSPYREYVFETLRTVQVNPLDGNTDVDVLAGDLGPLKPTWTVSATRGAFTITKNQLASGDALQLGSPDHFLIALTDVDLTLSGSKRPGGVVLSAAESERLPGGMERELKNHGPSSARFVVVEF